MAAKKKDKTEAVSVTLSTGTKVTASQEVVDKLKKEADRKSAAAKKAASSK